MGKQRMKPNYHRRVLRLPDLDHCKLSVLNSLGSPASRRVYEYAIDQFIACYCSEPRLAFNRIVVIRYMCLASRGLAANTINQQLASVRRLAHEAADSGLLSPELAAGISRVKGVKQLGFRSGNWLSADQSSEVLRGANGDSVRAKRDYAMLAMLFGCGFRRSELVGLELDEIQMRQGHWAVVDLIGKGGHIRTVPIPGWVKAALDQWMVAARVTEGRIFRAVARTGKVWGKGISQNWCGTSSGAVARGWAWSTSRRTTCGAMPSTGICRMLQPCRQDVPICRFLIRHRLGRSAKGKGRKERCTPWRSPQ
jgi:integrase